MKGDTGMWCEHNATDAADVLRHFRNFCYKDPWEYLSVKSESGEWQLARSVAKELGGFSEAQNAKCL
jgi:hypothetical protein